MTTLKKKKTTLYYCPDCKEPSCVRKVYTTKSGKTKKLDEYCINRGCSYRTILWERDVT